MNHGRRRFLRTGLITLAAVTGLAQARIIEPESRGLSYDDIRVAKEILRRNDEGWFPPLPLTLKDGPVFHQTRRERGQMRGPNGLILVTSDTIEQRRWQAVPWFEPNEPISRFEWVLDS